jgi:hypothetical protein
MLEDPTRPRKAGSPYGPFALTYNPAAQQRVLMQALRFRAEIFRNAASRPVTALVHRLRLAGLSVGRFVFDHGGLRSV